MYACMYVCMHACMYICMYACIYIFMNELIFVVTKANLQIVIVMFLQSGLASMVIQLYCATKLVVKNIPKQEKHRKKSQKNLVQKCKSCGLLLTSMLYLCMMILTIGIQKCQLYFTSLQKAAGLSTQVLLAQRFLDCDLLSSVEISSPLKWLKPLVYYLSKCPLCTVTLKAPAHPCSYDILKKHWRVNLSGNMAYYVIKVLSCMNSPAERKAE